MNTSSNKIFYIAPECFSDVDYPIVKELNRYYDFTWIVLFNDLKISYMPKVGPEEIQKYADKNNLKCNIFIRQGRLRGIRNLYFNYKLLKYIKKENPDTIYIESFIDPYFVILSCFMLDRKRVIIGIHDVTPHKKQLTILKIISTELQRRAFKIFHLFSKTQAEIFEKKYRNKITFVIPSCLKSIDGYKEINNTNTNTNINFLFWGNIRYNKGLDILIKAFNLLIEKGYSNSNLTIAGNSNIWIEYEKLILYPDKFKLLRYSIPNDEIPNLFTNIHYIILPYRDVTQSGPLLYAYNYNCPAIASNHKGFSEYIIDGFNGFLFENEKVESLFNVLVKVIYLSKEEHKEIKKNLSVFVKENISTKKIVKKYIDMLNSIG